MTNKKLFVLAVSVLLACSGLFTYGSPTKTAAEENSLATAKVHFAEEMDKKYAEEIALRPMMRQAINCDDLISQAFFAVGEEKESLLEELSYQGIYRFETEMSSQK